MALSHLVHIQDKLGEENFLIHDAKFKPWQSEVEHVTSRLQILFRRVLIICFLVKQILISLNAV